MEEHQLRERDHGGRRDLVIGLIGAVGTQLSLVQSIIESELQKYAYEYSLIKLSSLIKQFPRYQDLNRDAMNPRDYYSRAIEGGNAIRELLGPSALVQWGVLEIHKARSKPVKDPSRARCYVINQLKTPEEVRFLREVYGSLFYCIAVYADEKTREERLTRQFSHDAHRSLGPEVAGAAAKSVIQIDTKQPVEWGQNVRSAFVEADYFVRSDEQLDTSDAIERFFNLVFDRPYISPTKSEVAMMHAKTAALRSADLSRQIGAAIVARDGRVLTTGCNEVPKAGGGQYWENDKDDKRDWVIGYDANDEKKRQAILELINTLNDKIKNEYLESNFPVDVYDDLISGGKLDDAIVDSLIEFGRIVHAEQAAMNSAGIGGIVIRDADLYCTTYPCHMCARQIINSGIRNVFYIEPYPKSQVTELYEDSIEPNPRLSRQQYEDRINGDRMEPKKVYFIPFEGVAPRRYGDLFSNKRRKEADGKRKKFNWLKAQPRLAPTYADPYAAEKLIEESFGPKIAKVIAPASTVRQEEPSPQPSESLGG